MTSKSEFPLRPELALAAATDLPYSLTANQLTRATEVVINFYQSGLEAKNKPQVHKVKRKAIFQLKASCYF